MKKFLIGALMALSLLNFGISAQAADVEQENLCCNGNYYRGGQYCDQNCDNYDGEYCGRYGCGR